MQPTPIVETTATDPFRPLLDVTRRYRADVHALANAASEDAVRSAENHLGHRLPSALGGFLRRWNGGTLFRGALILRGSEELASPAASADGLVVFADGPGERRWAYTSDGSDGWVFGEVVDEALHPLHDSFHRWLEGTIRMLDEHVMDRQEEMVLRLECDPHCGWLQLVRGEHALKTGDVATAVEAFHHATSDHPELAVAWQRLGEILEDRNPVAARSALGKALDVLRFPSTWPGARTVDPSLVLRLSRLSGNETEHLERALSSFLEDRVSDVYSQAEASIFEAAAVELARLMLVRGRRRGAMELLGRSLVRSQSFQFRAVQAEMVLEFAHIASDLGEHDEAERFLRAVRDSEDPDLRGRALLALGRIAVHRHEPWAEEMLKEANALCTTPGQRSRIHVLLGQRFVWNERLDLAESALLEAEGLAEESSDGVISARVLVAKGDLARARGDMPAAEQAWRNARTAALAVDDEETLLRVLVRRGELHAQAGDLITAEADLVRAAEGYRKLELPLREAWALLRAARCGNAEALELARRRFLECDLSAGVAAVDALTGEPGRSLDWHLKRSTEHARCRYEAQRARPPLRRSDAERPERRLGAHRMAVSAGDVKVVTVLQAELATRAKQLESSTARAQDPAVAAYVAAADLLASHRSFEAAQALLDQLLHTRLPELPSRALKGAITRSPNIALVDGILETIEKQAGTSDLTGAIEVLGWRRERASVDRLLELAGAENPFTVRRAAVVALGRIGDRRAIEVLLEALEDERLASESAVSLLLLGDRRGVDFHAQSLATGSELDCAPGEIVGRYGGGSYLLLLRGIAEGKGPKALGALQGLGYLGDPRGMGVLLAALGRNDMTHVAVAAGALELLTGHHEDTNRPGLHACWEQWWERHEGGFDEGIRYRDGTVMTVDLLAGKLAHDDPLVRRGAYDELVISTGCHMPFDGDGPWRLQVAHRRAWNRWCKEHRDQFPAGRWWFDGAAV